MVAIASLATARGTSGLLLRIAMQRRSELVALNVEDLEGTLEGLSDGAKLTKRGRPLRPRRPMQKIVPFTLIRLRKAKALCPLLRNARESDLNSLPASSPSNGLVTRPVRVRAIRAFGTRSDSEPTAPVVRPVRPRAARRLVGR